MRKRKVAIGLTLVLFLAMAQACTKDPYTAAMQASLDVSNGVNDGITVVTQLEQDKLITQQETAAIAKYLGNLTVLNGKFRTSVKAVHSANPASTKAAYIPLAEAFVTSANDPTFLSAVHVVNPAAQAKVQAFLTAINTALNGIQLAINAAKGA